MYCIDNLFILFLPNNPFNHVIDFLDLGTFPHNPRLDDLGEDPGDSLPPSERHDGSLAGLAVLDQRAPHGACLPVGCLPLSDL